MSIESSNVQSRGATVLSEEKGVYGALFGKINLSPIKTLSSIEVFQNTEALSEVSADERVTAAVSVFLKLLKQSSQKFERLDKVLLDEHIAALDAQISRQLDAVMHHPDFQRVESTWRGVKSLNYDSLLSHDEQVLSADLLDKRALVVKPDEGMQLNIPLDKQARYVAVVALFRETDSRADTWRLTLAREDLDPDRVRVIELGGNRLTLRPLAKE
ncbi:type VI secretion system lipoprotein TssJ [Pseudomonas sp. WJP1]|uniref:type VI secretion system lipoprotein TssJ n=1 Tax=Pseudomonas sp. WJP1 TaxID=2986947 RepID=UPI0023490FF0|nr:type VI secretion system lipoprotein TssJ [Pseudomonas sp. WJP1]WCM53939.1 type VI secretion system lipoprotein TssJ [Pseudomonas sp. WJP1]